MASNPADPNSIEAMQRQIAELQAKLASVKQATLSSPSAAAHNIVTDGGAVVHGGIQTQGGDFIGRDFVQYLTQIIQQGEDPEEAKSVIAHYLYALVNDLSGLKLGEIYASTNQAQQSPLQLADIYVPLDTELHIPQGVTLAGWLDGKIGEADARREMRPVTALEALAEHRELTLLGSAGSGKSTFGASVLLNLAQAWQGHGDKLAELGENWIHGALLPIRIILRGFAEQLPAGEQMARAGDLWNFIARELDKSGHGMSTDTFKYVQRIARTHGAFVLFDGLDECGNEVRKNRVMYAVREFMDNAGPSCRFMLTARPSAFSEGTNPGRCVYKLADLNDTQIELFIRTWYAAMIARNWLPRGEAQSKMDDLLQVRQRHDLLPLTQKPLLLTLMAALHTNRTRLPDDRVDLYNESVELLMLRWNSKVGVDKALLEELNVQGLKLSDLRKALEVLAYRIHELNIGQKGAADINENELMKVFFRLLKSKDKADIVIEYIEKRAGLLIGEGTPDGEERKFTFPHRTFQEYLAACHLASKSDFVAECKRLTKQALGHWQVVLQLAARIAGAERGSSAADNLVHGCSISEYHIKLDVADSNCAWLAGTMLLEIGLGAINMEERTCTIAARVAGWLVASLSLHPDEGGASAIHRAQAGDVLAKLGDPRFDPQRFYLPADEMLGFVRIPADPEFCIGTREADKQRIKNITGYVGDNEINDDPTPTAEFYIAKYLVTVAQFRAFIETTGFQPNNIDALRDPDNRPVHSISWHEALKYCDWLNEQLSNGAGPIADLVRVGGYRITLPSELEWEKAARGGLRDAVYSWGDDTDANRANYSDTGISATSTVGCFPANGFGLHDMLGNVLEWTRSHLKDYPYTPDGRENLGAGENVLRVVRGGSWYDLRLNARCACRYGNHPVNRLDILGFRVVLRSAHVLQSLLLVTPYGGTARRDIRAVALRKCGPIRASGFVRRGEGRRTAPDKSGPRACRKAGSYRGIARTGRIFKLWHVQVSAPAVPRPAYPSFSGSPSLPLAAVTRVCRIHPPNNFPIPAIMRLTCSYCPMLSQANCCDRRRYKRSLFKCASADWRCMSRCAPLRAFASKMAS